MGIKSFQGKFEKPVKSLPESKVSDCMSVKLITFRPEQPVVQVINALIKHKISGGPVVNEKNELMGIISEGDCIKQISESQYYNMPIENVTVEQCMVREVETIDGSMSVIDAANKFLVAKRRRFPIVEGKKLVGLLSQKDILKATMNLCGTNWDRNQ